MSNILTRYNAPLRVTLGADRIPNYLSAESGQMIRWQPPPGMQLRVFCNGHELFFVLECDRERGWARTYPWEMVGGQARRVDKRGEDGQPIVRLYHGEISYKLVPARVPGWLRRLVRPR